MTLEALKAFLSQISCEIFGTKVYLYAETDKLYKKRVYIRGHYRKINPKTGNIEEFKGTKHYLSPYMLEDEVVKKAYKAFRDVMEYEIMQGFKFNDVVLFNPHVDYRKLLEISPVEVYRQQILPFDF